MDPLIDVISHRTAIEVLFNGAESNLLTRLREGFSQLIWHVWRSFVPSILLMFNYEHCIWIFATDFCRQQNFSNGSRKEAVRDLFYELSLSLSPKIAHNECTSSDNYFLVCTCRLDKISRKIRKQMKSGSVQIIGESEDRRTFKE